MTQYPVCPKCAHTSLPLDQALPAACPACGLILAKFSAVVTTATAAAPRRSPRLDGENSAFDDAGHHNADSLAPTRHEERGLLSRWLFHVPAEVSDINWYCRVAALRGF